MKITINGDIYITQYGESLSEITKDNNDVDFDFGYLEDDFDKFDDDLLYIDCDDCCYCDDDYTLEEVLDDVVDTYVELIAESCVCEDCIKDILLAFLDDMIAVSKEFVNNNLD